MEILEDWISQFQNLLPACEAIAQKSIKPRTWYTWERLAGAAPRKRRCNRVYSQEQTQLLLCLAWLRRIHPKKKVNYCSLREYWQSSEYKIWEVYEAIAEGKPPSQPQEKLVPLSQVKKCCDAIFARQISRDCWVRWKKHLGVEKRAKFVSEGTAALLVFVACWRHDHGRAKLPSVNRLLVMMNNDSRKGMSLATASSDTQFREWSRNGCSGGDLPKYLAAWGIKISPFTLYKWGGYSRRKHYSPRELSDWIYKARRTRCSVEIA